MRYAFFPGCTLESAAEELMISTMKVAEALGIELIELKGWTCCGASHIQDIDDFLATSINARNIALGEKLGVSKIITVCNTCTLMLRTAKAKLDKNKKLRTRVNESLRSTGMQYKGNVEVTHLLWALIEDYGLDRLKEKVKRPLTGLKVANFYGCHILMPPKIMGFENHMNPQSMEMIAEVLGAESVKFDQRLACCGFHAVFPAEKEVMNLTGMNCLSPKASGADCLITPCPLCQMQLDAYQPDAQKGFSKDITMPVLHLPQLIGLALGFSPQELAIQRHVVDAIPVLTENVLV
ncbi:CoB--CoM heterodisulfide reductase iron-sulfur subunit B family protein [Cytobacillus solani]|uniref:Heterodisulfide reductase subunit B n=1 Tax=Cytobacillus solani TaxID=1637975 RepID=A0A0Q3VHD3_9BACI|nr:CoB--CoM heterodisulfide reductase iron-sulfur subunit B family protein [Cytobacillus solani]KOP82389.1 heterodisulfide reductase subunit B [Bacillus sp. FJAT-21945]KQL19399.1 heterodisulfide reductase subunit B [Cytobacillus solani]USK57316.1 CoB--CoM heterodisulfide reductase iron-sulfur subunit B family protein [Cytobacillus solani]